MAYCMEEAAKAQIAFFVLDRPNPLNGDIVEGPMLDAEENFVVVLPVARTLWLTSASLPQFYNVENHINADLHVIR